jgi:hypothetical protein
VAGQLARPGAEFARELLTSNYGVFWRAFSKAVKNDQNVPWEQIKDLRLQPEFVGIAFGLIDGNDGARDSLKELLAGFEAAPNAYESTEQVREKLYTAALQAASAAPKDDRRALFAAERRLDESIRRESGRTQDAVGEVAKGVSDLGVSVDQIADSVDELKERLDVPGDLRSAAVDKEVIDEQVAAEFRRAQEEWRVEASVHLKRLEGLLDRMGPTGADTGGADGKPAERLSRTSVGGQSAQGRLAELSETNSADAAVLEEVLEAEGSSGIVEMIRARSIPRSVEALDTAAEVVALDGFFREAERAHLEASGLATDEKKQAQQLVRAASMAQIQGAQERFRTLLEDARRVEPDLAAIAIVEARQLDDGNEMLARLDGVKPESTKQSALFHVSRSQALLLKGDIAAAREELVIAEDFDASLIPVREVRAMIPWIEAKSVLAEGGRPDGGALLAAAAEFEAIGSMIAGQQRLDEAAHVLARSAESYALADMTESAVRVLHSVGNPVALSEDARIALAESAILARAPEMVAEVGLGPDGGPDARLVWSDAEFLREESTPQSRSLAYERLHGLLENSPPDLEARAAFALLVGAAAHLDVPWDKDAERIVTENMPTATAVMKAERLEREGRSGEAEARLLAFGTDPKALRQLRDYSAGREEWTKARDQSARLFAITRQPIDRLALADTTAKAGDSQKAKEHFLALAGDSATPDRLRGMAFGGAAGIASEASEYEEVRNLAEDWHRQLPGDPDGLWNLAFAHARLANPEEAYRLLIEEKADPDTPQKATLLAEIMSRAIPKADALERIAALSDRYGRDLEALEAIYLKTALEAEQDAEDLPEEQAERIRETWSSFPTRFPDQEFIQVLEAPETPEGFEELLREFGGGETARLQKDAIQSVVDGAAPVNVLAAATPNPSIGRCWLGLGFLPLGFSAAAEEEEEELATARDALGGAVTMDSSSLYITAGLGARHTDAILGALPGSLIANETLEDADAALGSVPLSGNSETVHDPDTGSFLGLRENSDAEIELLRRVARGMLDLARSLGTRPGVGEGTRPELSEAFDQANRHPMKALISTLALADGSQTPLFSDDRWVRSAARSLAIPAFGTIALVGALLEKEILDAERSDQIREKLVRSGAWGMPMSAPDLVAAGRRSNWRLDDYLAGALGDRASWRARPSAQIQAVLRLVSAAEEARPDLSDAWIQVAMAAFDRWLPEVEPTMGARIFLELAWGIGDEDEVSRECFLRIVDHVRSLPLKRRGTAPVLTALDELMEAFSGESEHLRLLVFMRLIGRLRPKDALMAFFQFVQPGPSLLDPSALDPRLRSRKGDSQRHGRKRR